MRALFIAALVGIIIGLAAGLAIGYWLWHQEPTPTVQSFKPAIVQDDGSVVVQRIPNATPSKAPHTIPKGARETRRIHIVAKPEPVDPGIKGCECKPAEIDLSLIKWPDGTDGSVISGEGIDSARSIDAPITDDPAPYRHFIAIDGAPKGYGVLIGKHWGRLSAGIGMRKERGDGYQPQAGVMISW